MRRRPEAVQCPRTEREVNMRRRYAAVLMAVVALLLLFLAQSDAFAQGIPTIKGLERSNNPEDVVTTLEIVILLLILTFAPAILLMMTAFVRIVIVLSFVRRALSTQELPPNQIIIGLSLILTVMVMMPTLTKIKDNALDPYLDRQITQKTAIKNAMDPLRDFMFGQTRVKDIQLFADVTGVAKDFPKDRQIQRKDIPSEILVPAFVISELRRAFIMGFMIFLPFVVVDLVVSSILISMGMLVLPPILISLPFKILLFILVDGWNLIIVALVKSFYV